MKNNNRTEYNLLNMNKWEKYDGKGIKVATLETVGRNDVKPFRIISQDSYGNGHGKNTALTCLITAPGIELHSLKSSSLSISLKYILDNSIDIVFASLTGGIGSMKKEDLEALKTAKEKGVIFITSAGNDDRGIGSFTSSGEWINVLALGYSNRDREIYIPDYSENSSYTDCCGFGTIYLPDAPHDYGFSKPFTGTSFAAPFVTGLVAKVLQYFNEVVGKKPNHDGIVEFIKDYSDKLNFSEDKVGYGLFKLPKDIDLIDIDRYFNKEVEEEVELEDEKPLKNDIDKFTDINKDSWYYDSFKYLYEKGIVKGQYTNGEWKANPNREAKNREVWSLLAEIIKYLEK